jgi:GTPase SAR1 family protein
MNEEELPFKISLLGPSRVGKTTIIASVLQGGQQLLIGTPVTMRAADNLTNRRITETRQALLGAVYSGEFRPDSLQNTSAPSRYSLLLDPGVEGAGVLFDCLDFPGGWLNPLDRPDSSEQQWRECEQFILDSSVLIVPIDAAVLMEAARNEHRGAWPSILTIDSVEEVAGNWAAGRKLRSDEPALVLFCPVKCESYFADNGGWRDDSDELFRRVLDVYGEMIARIKGECPRAVMEYIPIDTLGCVELRSAEWVPDPSERSGWRFEPAFTLRGDGPGGRPRIRTKGVDDVLSALCRQLMNARRAADKAAVDAAEAHHRATQAWATQREGLFKDIWLWATKQRETRLILAGQAGRAADEKRARLEAIDKVVADIAIRERDRRVRDL